MGFIWACVCVGRSQPSCRIPMRGFFYARDLYLATPLFSFAELRGCALLGHEVSIPAGCSKRPSCKAAASEGPKAYPLWYVVGLNDARAPLADFFGSLLNVKCMDALRYE